MYYTGRLEVFNEKFLDVSNLNSFSVEFDEHIFQFNIRILWLKCNLTSDLDFRYSVNDGSLLLS